MQNMQMTGGFRLKVSAVVLALDALSGASVPGARVMIVGEAKLPERKNDGFFVFSNVERDEALIVAEAPGYFPASARVMLGSLSPLEPVLRLRLSPHAPPNGAALIIGRALDARGDVLPGACVRVREGRRLRLMADAKAGDGLLRIFTLAGEDLGGLGLLLETEEGQFPLQLLGREEEGYRLAFPLPVNAARASAKLWRVHQAYAGNDGRFGVALRVDEEQTVLIEPEHAESTQFVLTVGGIFDVGDIAPAAKVEDTLPRTKGNKKKKGR